MKKRQLLMGLGLVLLLVAAMLPSLTSCSSKTNPTTSTTTTTTTVVNSTTPVYGGTMTVLNDVGAQDPNSFDIGTTQMGNVTSVYINPYLEPFFAGDINTYGPRGSNAYAFQTDAYIPDQYLAGNIAQSWSFQENPLSLTITLKQGIMWTGNSNIGMAPRELTAQDCVFAETRQFQAPSMAPYFTWIKDCVAVDQYTFKYDFNSYQVGWEFYLLYGGGLAFPFAPESANAPNGGGANWKNAVGTGPFELSSFVDGSSVTYTKNSNYWGKATIAGTQYSTPFIQSLVYLIIPDQSTQLAAMQTGKLDLWTLVPETQGSTLQQQAPDMIQEKWVSDSLDIMIMNRNAAGPLSNLQVRQALCEATDFNTIAQNVYGGGDILGWPVARGNPSYTPVEDESSQIQALFSFNTTEAQQMLTAAGYPKGFTTSITIDSAYSQEADEATIIAADWAKVGVTVKIIQINTTALAEERDNDSYTGLICFPVFTDSSTTPLAWYQGNTLGGEYKTGEPLDIEANSALQEEDPAKQQTDVTQFCKDAILDCGIIGMPNPYVINCYWPWLRNYYGEIDAAYHNQVPMISELWIDQTLKTSDGYR